MHEDLKWLFGVLIFFGIFWYVSGMYNRNASERPLITGPTVNVNTGGESATSNLTRISAPGAITAAPSGRTGQDETIGGNPAKEEITRSLTQAGLQAEQIQKELALFEGKGNTSPLADKIFIANVNRSGMGGENEYLVLKAAEANKESVLITGMRLKSEISGAGVDIPKAARLPFQNEINVEESLYLAPGETAYIVSGRSPLGMSFRLNKCTGFYGQFQTFNPQLPTRCPAPKDDPLPPPANQYNDQCLDYIDRLLSCQVVISPPANISPECRRYVTTEINYTKCVERHKNDRDFYDREWRVYLKRDDTLWKSRRELIHLLDQNGKIVDAIAY